MKSVFEQHVSVPARPDFDTSLVDSFRKFTFFPKQNSGESTSTLDVDSPTNLLALNVLLLILLVVELLVEDFDHRSNVTLPISNAKL